MDDELLISMVTELQNSLSGRNDAFAPFLFSLGSAVAYSLWIMFSCKPDRPLSALPGVFEPLKRGAFSLRRVSL